MFEVISWDVLLERATNGNPLDQISALAQAQAKLERALTAVGIPVSNQTGYRIPTRRRLLEARRLGARTWPPEAELDAAIEARNKAVHDFPRGAVNHFSRRSSRDHVECFREAWKVLRTMYVTPDCAARLAERFLHPTILPRSEPDSLESDISETIDSVYLFGSLARGISEPADIDLLLIDRGVLSLLLTYEDESPSALLEVLDDRGFLTATERAAAASGWLDIVAINGQQFESNLAYRTGMFSAQHDHLFFVNIAPDLRIYDEGQRQWHAHQPAPFEEFVVLGQYLDKLGIPRFRRRRL